MKTLIYITLIVGASLLSGCGQVETGEAGFFTRWGKIISTEPLSDGLHCYMPIGTDLIVYDIKNQSVEATTDVFTKDIQSMKLKFQVTYNLDKSKIMELHAKTGRSYQNTIIAPAILGAAKDAIGKLEADKIVSERETVTHTIEDNISNALKPHGINITFVKLLNIDYSDAFERAVEEKQVTLQNSIKEKNQTARLREVAEQQIIKAEAEAKSKVLNSEAEAKAILVKAEAEAKAIEMKNKALASSTALIDYTLAQQWDGKLPVQMLGTTPVPFINLNKEGTK